MKPMSIFFLEQTPVDFLMDYGQYKRIPGDIYGNITYLLQILKLDLGQLWIGLTSMEVDYHS